MTSLDDRPTLPLPEIAKRVENAAALFEAAQDRGENPAIEAYLPENRAERRAVLVELAHADLEFRLKQGEPARVESYLERFPELAGDSHLLCELIAAEWEFRKRREPGIALSEYITRFPALRGELPRLLLPFNATHVESLLNSRDPTLAADSSKQPHPTTALNPFGSQSLGYEILTELGRGGMGVVYRARDTKRGQHVALKTLQWVDAGALYRFKQEFRALADVSHPNLVSLHELVSDGERWFFTMELVDGVDFFSYVRPAIELLDESARIERALAPGGDEDTLAQEIRSAGALSEEQLRKLRGALIQLTEGLLALHGAGKLHRDIKPRNILVTPQGRVVLLDFGLAADLGRTGIHHSTEQHIVGTVSYMSPEQAMALPLTSATDWFSLGVVLYEVLTGHLPRLDRSSLPAMLRPPSSSTERLQPPCELVPETPADLSDICVALLKNDPAARLAGTELLARLKGSFAPAEPTPAPILRHAAPFIGRELQLRVLRESLASVRKGNTEVVFVQGHSGAGKSALIQHFLDAAEHAEPTVVLAGRCYERESVPYKALDSAVDELCRYLRRLPDHEAETLLPRNMLSLARVFPVLRRVSGVAKANERGIDTPDPQEVRRRAFSALRELLARIGDRKPLIVYIDDLQWGDADSAEFITELLRPPDAPVLLFLGSYRTDEGGTSPLLKKLKTAPQSITPLARRKDIALDTLSADEAEDLAIMLLGSSDALACEQAAVVARESRGNPFFVHELVQYVKQGSGLSEGSSASGEILLERMLWERVQRLPEQSRRLLEVLAVAGQPLPASQAGLAAAVNAESHSAITALRSNHLVKASGGGDDSRIEPYHDRMREIVVSRLAPEALRAYHLRLAETLATAGNADPEQLAKHYQGAGDMVRAGEYYAEAASVAAETLAFDHAAQLFRLALKLKPASGEALRQLLERLGDALANASRGAEAAMEFLKAAALAEGRLALDLQRRAAEQYMVSGHIDEGLAVLAKVLAAVGLKLPGTPKQALASLLFNRARLWLRGLRFREREVSQIPPEELMRIDACWSVTAGLSMVDTIRGADFQTRQLLYALHAGEPGRISRALSFEAGHVASEGGRQGHRAEQLLQAAEQLAARVGMPQAKATATAARGIVAGLLGNWPEARLQSDRAEAQLRDECTGMAWELSTARRFAFWARIYMGELAEIAERLPSLLKDARERNDLYAITNLNNVVLPMIYLAADEPDRIAAEVYAAEPPARNEFHVQHYARLSDLSQTDLYCGRGLAAWERVEAQWPKVGGSFLLRVQQIRIFMHYLRGRAAILAAGQAASRRDALLKSADRDSVQLAREQMPWSDGLALLLRACVAQSRGETHEATQGFAQAAEQLEAVSMRLHAAAARHRQGTLMGGSAGGQITTTAEQWMTGQTVKNPNRMTNMLAPVASS